MITEEQKRLMKNLADIYLEIVKEYNNDEEFADFVDNLNIWKESIDEMAEKILTETE